jgi:hypothetical protein
MIALYAKRYSRGAGAVNARVGALAISIQVSGSGKGAFGWVDQARGAACRLPLLRHTIGLERIDEAAHWLYDEGVLNMGKDNFDEKVASYSDVFWAAGLCAHADECDEGVVKSVFCFDFETSNMPG